MNKMEILALLFRCNAKVDEYLKNNTFDDTKVSAAQLNQILIDLNTDYTAIEAMPDGSDFSAYETRLTSLETSLQSVAKIVIDDLDEAQKALDALTDCQKKLEEIAKKTILSEKAKKTLSLIAKCQKQLEELGKTTVLDPTVKVVFDRAAAAVGLDFNKVAQGLSDADLDAMYDKYENLSKQIEIVMGRGANVPTKKEVLDLMFSCKKDATDLLSGSIVKLRKKDKKYLSALVVEIGNDYMDAQNLEEKDPELLNYFAKYSNIAKELNDLQNGISNRHKVKGVVPASRVPSATAESRKEILFTILKVLGIGAAGAVIALIIAGLIKLNGDKLVNNDPATTPTLPPDVPGHEEIVDTTLSAANININNYEELLNHAMTIQSKLPAESEITIDDIMYAVRLANFDNLEDKGIYSDRDEVCAATYYIGKLAPVVGVDALVQRTPGEDITLSDAQMQDIVMTTTDLTLNVEDFAAAKVDGGYDIYRVAQICLEGLYQDNDKAFFFAKVMNELVCREAVNYSVCADSPVSTHYTIAGMYTANQDRILELTANQALGPIYGTGPRIDGGHGALCVEELASFMYIDTKSGTFIGNEKNAIYSFVLDENITCYYGQAR